VSSERTSVQPIVVALAIALIALALTTNTADAASTRAEYVAQADPICESVEKPVSKALGRYFKTLERKGLIEDSNSAETVRTAGGAVARVAHRWARIYGNVTTGLSTIAAPPGDEITISTWLQARGTVKELLDQGARASKRRKVHRVAVLSKRVGAAVRTANDQVRDFGFLSCAPEGSTLFEFGPLP
jgi:hypothetical protein